MDSSIARGYRSRSQIARVITEDWAARHLYCPACASGRLCPLPNNTRARDYDCPSCGSGYQLKSSARWSERRIPDAGYEAMMHAIRSDRVPNLLVMQYATDWTVRNLLLVPSFFFAASAIERRNPLGPTARRAGWVGCNILLGAIAPEGRVPIVVEGVAISASDVRRHYARVRPLAEVNASVRGWTLDVLRVVRELERTRFSLNEVYAFEPRLRELHPRNRNIRPKIRQQLQVLRDLGMLEFVSKGRYKLRSAPLATLRGAAG